MLFDTQNLLFFVELMGRCRFVATAPPPASNILVTRKQETLRELQRVYRIGYIRMPVAIY